MCEPYITGSYRGDVGVPSTRLVINVFALVENLLLTQVKPLSMINRPEIDIGIMIRNIYDTKNSQCNISNCVRRDCIYDFIFFSNRQEFWWWL